MMYFVRMTRSRSKATRFGESSSSEKIVSAGDDMIPAPKMRRPFRRLDQAELDRVPVEPREIVELPARRAPAGRPCHRLRESAHRLGLARSGTWPKTSWKTSGSCRYSSSGFRADESAGGKAPIGEMIEEGVIGNEPGHRTTLQPVIAANRLLRSANSGMPERDSSSFASPPETRRRRGRARASPGGRKAGSSDRAPRRCRRPSSDRSSSPPVAAPARIDSCFRSRAAVPSRVSVVEAVSLQHIGAPSRLAR